MYPDDSLRAPEGNFGTRRWRHIGTTFILAVFYPKTTHNSVVIRNEQLLPRNGRPSQKRAANFIAPLFISAIIQSEADQSSIGSGDRTSFPAITGDASARRRRV